MIARGQNFKQQELNIVGSSIFGRAPKISIEKTYNMFESDGFLVPYSGYKVAINNMVGNANGRGIHSSTIFNKLFAVIGSGFYQIDLSFNQQNEVAYDVNIILIGNLQTSVGNVFIAENNKPQIAISDGNAIYIYDPTQTPTFQAANINFTPGYIDFHDTYFLCASANDQTQNGQSNVWRLSASNNGLSWPQDSAHIGLLQTKPDDVQAVVRFPSKGNMILVIGSTVSEAWFDVGYQLFPYQRSTQFSIDYGCINPATIARMDELVVWLAQNEQSGPIIIYTTGGIPQKITTDGIDYLMSQLTNPADSQAFLYRQDGHLFYHINFYTDNLSLFYDFNTKKFYHACDENLNYFIADNIAFFNNQYYFLSKNNANLYAFDTIYSTYNGAEIPRIRTCRNTRLASQEYFIVNDVGFTIESGETPYQMQSVGPVYLITQNDNNIITQDNNFLISNNNGIIYTTPRVDLSISIDGGASFSRDMPYILPGIGQRKNRLYWWNIGLANDIVCQFKFWGIGRFISTNGIINVRQ